MGLASPRSKRRGPWNTGDGKRVGDPSGNGGLMRLSTIPNDSFMVMVPGPGVPTPYAATRRLRIDVACDPSARVASGAIQLLRRQPHVHSINARFSFFFAQ